MNDVPSESPANRWTGVAELRALSRTTWNRGSLLRELIDPTQTYPRRRPLKKPTAAQLRTDFGAAKAWAGELFAASGDFTMETVDLGRTTIGSNAVPSAVVFASAREEIAFVGKGREAQRFVSLTERLVGVEPLLKTWALKRPLELLDCGQRAITAARVALWLQENPSPGIYLRQLSLPGVDTKFVEGHRRIIEAMATILATGAAASGEAPAADASRETDSPAAAEPASLLVTPSSPAARFAQRHGFLHPPERVRFRMLDPAIPVLGGARDLTITAEAFASLELPVERVVVTENLVNFLALPERPRTLALFGGGYGFSMLRDARWLHGCQVHYWGDLDTHGFVILDQLRSLHPGVASVLMDEATLLGHREIWGIEPTPSRATLTRLTDPEASVYQALRDDEHGPAVRLEQELIRWQWVLDRLP